MAAVGTAAVVAAAATTAGCGNAKPASRRLPGAGNALRVGVPLTRRSFSRPAAVRRHTGYAVGELVLNFLYHSRVIRLDGQRAQPRRLITVVRFPDHTPGPFPLVVFGHGFAATPSYYARLLDAWAHAGYVVAAPVFPLTNADAPGGPREADIVNQPTDMSFVITRLLAANADPRGPLAHLIDPRQIAVSGQSDGGETALAAAYFPNYLDRRVRAVILLSGAKLSGLTASEFPQPSPPVLATQGTADTIDAPQHTYDFYHLAPPPKYLLKLQGAGHLAPYTDEQPQLSIVGRVTIAFLDRYLKGSPDAIRRLTSAGNVPGISVIEAQP